MADRRARLRAGVAAVGVGVLLLGPFAGSASAAPSRRVVVMWLDGTSLDDWMRFGGPALRGVLADGAVGVVHTGPARRGINRAAQEAGANPEVGHLGALRPSGERRGLGETYTAADASVGFVGSPVTDGSGEGAYVLDGIVRMFGQDSRIASGSGRPYRTRDPSTPGGFRTDTEALTQDLVALIGTTSFVAVDVQDPARFDSALEDDPVARERWIARALVAADPAIAAARAAVGADGTVMVLSAPGPRAREARGEHLGAVAIAGAAFPRGLLTSSTSRVPGLVSLIDMTPTILRAAGLPSSPSLRGTAMTVSRGAGGAARARRLDRDLTTAARARPRVVAALFGTLALASLLTALLFVVRRGRAPRGRVPRRLRDVPLLLFTGCALAPAVLLFTSDWRAAGLAGAGAFLVRLVVRARWSVPVAGLIGGLSPAVVTLVTPARSAALAVGGARAAVLPPGGDPAVVGLALCAALIALGALNDRRTMGTWLRVGAPLVLGAGAAVLAADVRMIAVGGLGCVWFISRDSGWTVWRVGVGVGALATIAAAAVVLAGPEPFVYAAEGRAFLRAHGARFGTARVGIDAVAVLAGISLAAAVFLRRAEAARASFGSPGARAGIGGAIAIAIAIAVAYPGGASAAAWVLLPAVATSGAMLTGASAR